jgi:hypothetical protein
LAYSITSERRDSKGAADPLSMRVESDHGRRQVSAKPLPEKVSRTNPRLAKMMMMKLRRRLQQQPPPPPPPLSVDIRVDNDTPLN